MKLELNWVNDIIDLGDLSPQKLNYITQRLVDGGFEVEDIYKMNEAIILDISAPANLAESLSICGMIKELSFLLNKPYKPLSTNSKLFRYKTTYKTSNTLNKNSLIFKNKNFTAFGVTIIENIENLKTPEWIKQRLEIDDIEVTNTVLDYQNYILIETGYPFEFYDLHKIKNKTKIENEEKSIRFEITNDKDSQLNKSIFFFKANRLSIGIAGVSPLKSFECDKNTKSILIETSVFPSSFIRKQSRLTGYKTRRSIRYEKEIENHEVINAHDRLIKLILENCDKATYSINIPIKQIINTNSTIKLTYTKFIEIVNELNSKKYPLRDTIDPKLISEYLTTLNYDFNYKKEKNSWIVKIPQHRSISVSRPVHLVQEISRLHGFDKFSARLPLIKNSGKNDKTYKLKLILSSYLLDLGLNEFINYSINPYTQNYIDTFSVINPLIKNQKRLQNSLFSNLLQSVGENLKNGNNFIEGFEFSHVFSLLSDVSIINEKESLSGIFKTQNLKNNWILDSDTENWVNAKGKFQKLFQQLGIKIKWSNYNLKRYNDILNSNLVSSITTECGEFLGIIGQVNPLYSKNVGEYKNIFMFEFNLDVIKNRMDESKLLTSYEYPKYPTIMVNVSFKHHSLLNCDHLKNLIMINGTKVLIGVNTCNIVTKQIFTEEKYNYVFTLIFQSTENTLSKNKIMLIVSEIEKKINLYIKSLNDNSISK